ncbi:cytochrome P450 [Glonium stellatum]|uniref:Cytochrome P450 n=1 Tax=Glonium stellatum TaxID=574774 RepID=A0A8E2EY04_9PEZI|nr:cytochrome P450 [Glonium stellatum]
MSYMQSRKGMGFSLLDLLSGFDWNSVGTVVDVGGGHGTTSKDIVGNTASTRCIVQDLPNVVEGLEEKLPTELADRITFIGHDFFTEQPVKNADFILHGLGVVTYNIFFHPLAKFPGPTVRAAFSFPGIYRWWKGNSHRKVQELHEKYGNVVRIAPDTLSFIGVQAWKDIYGFRPGKSQIPKDYKRFPDEKLLRYTASNDVDHGRMRKLMAHAFSNTALREQHPLVANHINSLINELNARTTGHMNVTVDMSHWLNLLAFDIITDLSFGQPLGAVKSGGRHPYIEDLFMGCRIFPLIPTAWEYNIVRLLLKAMMAIPYIRRKQEIGYLGAKLKVEKRMAVKQTERKDFMTYILRHNDERGMTHSEIVGSTTVFVSAGGESTASAMAGITYYMLRDSAVLEKAQEEVRMKFRSQGEIIAGPLEKLDYLNAVIEEGLRIYPSNPQTFARRTGANVEMVDGHPIPPNTSLGVNPWANNHSASNFANPDNFAPERWLDDTPKEYRNDVKAALQSWSMGPRNCMGRNLAYLEMRATLATLLWAFDMELCEESRNWAVDQHLNIVFIRPPLLVKIRPRHIDV